MQEPNHEPPSAIGLDHGSRLVRSGDLTEAVDVLRQVIASTPEADPRRGYAALQLGNALRYHGDVEAAARSYASARALAGQVGDLVLAIAAASGSGETAFAAGEPKAAAIAFGTALGLTENSSDERLSVVPMAGLADAHHAWARERGRPTPSAKAVTLANRALLRARSQNPGDVAFARALLASGRVEARADRLLEAVDVARTAPHLPLAVMAELALWRLAPTEAAAASLRREAAGYGMNAVVAELDAGPAKGTADHDGT